MLNITFKKDKAPVKIVINKNVLSEEGIHAYYPLLDGKRLEHSCVLVRPLMREDKYTIVFKNNFIMEPRTRKDLYEIPVTYNWLKSYPSLIEAKLSLIHLINEGLLK